LDPRTKILLVLASSLAVMAPNGDIFVPATIILGTLLALVERALVRAVMLPVVAEALAAVAYLLPTLVVHPAVGVIGILAAYLLRLVAIGGIAVYLVGTTTPTEFGAALRAARIPRAITVSGAVMLRFLPTIVAEARAVRDAMRLRGIGGVFAMLRRPIRSIEYFTVPLVASSLRVTEDLSATALLRGLGSATHPTTMQPCRLGWPDGLVVAVAAALAAPSMIQLAQP